MQTANDLNSLTTIKADSFIVEEIRRIAQSEGRKIQTVTNRLLKFAIDNYNEIPDPNNPNSTFSKSV